MNTKISVKIPLSIKAIILGIENILKVLLEDKKNPQNAIDNST